LQKEEPSCSICSKLLLVARAAAPPPPSLWTRAELLGSDCVIHRLLIFHCLNSTANVSSAASMNNEMIRLSDDAGRLYIDEGPTEHTFEPVKHQNLGSSRGHGKIINTNWIEINLVRSWKNRCESRHVNCKSPILQTLLTKRPYLLIDTWRICLIKATPEDVYMVLSYV
jgi:hypothetical protein